MSKDTINRVKGNPGNGRENLRIAYPVRSLYVEYMKECLQLKHKQTPFLKGAKELNRRLSREDIQTAKKHTQRRSMLSVTGKRKSEHPELTTSQPRGAAAGEAETASAGRGATGPSRAAGGSAECLWKQERASSQIKPRTSIGPTTLLLGVCPKN